MSRQRIDHVSDLGQEWVEKEGLQTLVVLVARRVAGSSHGRSLWAIREDEIAAEAMGVNTTGYKVRAFVISAFFAGMAEARRSWMEPANPLYLQYWVTVYGALRLHGGPLVLAYAAQAVVGVAAACALVYALRLRPAAVRSGRAEVAAIAACVPFCSPFLLEYDLLILAVPMAWLLGEALRDGFRPGERIALVAAYLAPALFKVTLFDHAMKLFVIAAAGLLFVAVLRRMMFEARPCNLTSADAPLLDGRMPPRAPS